MAGELNVQILGLCRFSYLGGEGAFQSTPAGLEARRAFLYDPARLDVRMFWFRRVLLPCVAGQTDPDFKLLLLMGEDFPEPYRSELLSLIEPIAQIIPIFRPPGPPREVYRAALKDARDPAADYVAEFRMDDDDAVAVDFVAQLRRTVGWAQPMMRQTGRCAVDFQRGMVVEFGAGVPEFKPVIANYWTPALALALKPDEETCIMDYPHHQIWFRNPTLTLSNQLMFLRGSHANNDSHIDLSKIKEFTMPQDQIEDRLLSRFALDYNELSTTDH